MRDMFFSIQPMEITELAPLEQTFRMIKAETQLCTRPTIRTGISTCLTIYDLPFLDETAKRNILGGNAMQLFNLDMPVGKMAAAE